jgi:hypothetical protein
VSGAALWSLDRRGLLRRVVAVAVVTVVGGGHELSDATVRGISAGRGRAGDHRGVG